MAAIDCVKEMIKRCATSRLFFHLQMTERRLNELSKNRKKDLLSSKRYQAKFGYQTTVREAIYAELADRFERIDFGALEALIETQTTFNLHD